MHPREAGIPQDEIYPEGVVQVLDPETEDSRQTLLPKQPSPDLLLGREIDHCIAMLSHVKNKNTISFSVSLTMSLLLVAGAITTFIHVLLVRNDKQQSLNNRMQDIQTWWHDGPLDRVYHYWRQDINACRREV